LVEFEDHRTGDNEDKSAGDHYSVNAWMVGRLYEVMVSEGNFVVRKNFTDLIFLAKDGRTDDATNTASTH